MKTSGHLLKINQAVDIKKEIETALSVLIGQPFWYARRVVNLELLDFGPRHPSTNRKGQPIEYGEYSLHISCSWRFTHMDQIMVSHGDMYYPPDGSANPPDDFNWDTEMGNLHDVRMKSFLETRAEHPLIVESIEAGRAGSVSIFFNDDYVLDLFPDTSFPAGENYREHWRFFKDKSDHFVVTGEGIES